ncbi:MAG: pitrilysin family protein [Candidatus Andersenbacteria bacterium]
MQDFPLARKTLPSGLRTLLLPRKDVQSVTFLVLIGVGSRYETLKQNGLSHFLEHMFFKGTETRPTAKQIAEAIDGVGGEFNAFTGEEYTGYYVKVAAEHLQHGAEVVSDILLRPLFPQVEIEKERGVIIEEIRMYTDMPMRHIHHLWNEALYGDHPLGRRIDGDEATVSKFMRKDFLGYTNKHYHTKNAVVAVAGNFEEKSTQALLKDLFSPLSKGEETTPKAAPRRVPHQRFVHEHRKHLDQSHLMVGVPGYARDDDRNYAASLLSAILGNGMSSRLFSVVREQHGLAYMVRTMADHYTDTGSFVTQAGVRTDKAAQALELILAEYDRIQSEPVTEEELHKAKQMARGGMVLSLEETNSIAMFAAEQELLETKMKTPADLWKKLERVTVQDVQEVAVDLLDPERRTVALLSPHKSTKSFEKLLY